MPLVLAKLAALGAVTVGALFAVRQTVETAGSEIRKTLPVVVVAAAVGVALYAFSGRS